MEYASLIILLLLAAAMVGNASKGRSLAMALPQLLLGIVGTDPNSGLNRMTFGMLSRADGMTVVVVTTGLFGISEVLSNVGRIGGREAAFTRITIRDMLPTREKKLGPGPSPRCAAVRLGLFLEFCPAPGAALSIFVAYAVENRLSKTPERFGEGALCFGGGKQLGSANRIRANAQPQYSRRRDCCDHAWGPSSSMVECRVHNLSATIESCSGVLSQAF